MEQIAYTVEDCLEILTGLKNSVGKFELRENDKSILTSIGRQVVRGIALTDRQHNLLKEKLMNYSDQFEQNGYNNLESCLDNLRHPLRKIDRTKTIKIVHGIDNKRGRGFSGYRPMTDEMINSDWIEIKFPFNKKTILVIEELAKKFKDEHSHKKGNKEHYFLYSPKSCYSIIDALKDKNFVIEEDLVNVYNESKSIVDNKENFIPRLTEKGFVNVNSRVTDILTQKLGLFTEETYASYYDRRFKYGFTVAPDIKTGNELTDNILKRHKPFIHLKPSEHSLEDILSVLSDLQRFPLLVGLDDRNSLPELEKTFNGVKEYISGEQQTVLFRKENPTGSTHPFNQYIHDNSLNNKLDKNTKIVYINNKKLPKPLVKADWKPEAYLAFKSQYVTNNIVESYINYYCDLSVYYEEHESPFFKLR